MQRALVTVLLFGATSLLVAPSHAQNTPRFSLGEPVTSGAPIAPLVLRTIDEERLFQQSEFGQRVTAEIEAASRALETQNDALLAELTQREAELTETRSEMSVEEFRSAANEFDLFAETTRREQAEKRERLVQFEESERRRFFGATGPILQEVLAEIGGQILIDSRAVVITAPGVDMTPEAIDAIDEAIGDGGPAPFPLSLP